MKLREQNLVLSFRSPYNKIFLTSLEHHFVSIEFILKHEQITCSKFGACKHPCKNSLKTALQQTVDQIGILFNLKLCDPKRNHSSTFQLLRPPSFWRSYETVSIL